MSGWGWPTPEEEEAERVRIKKMQELKDLFDTAINYLKCMRDEVDDPGAFENRKVNQIRTHNRTQNKNDRGCGGDWQAPVGQDSLCTKTRGFQGRCRNYQDPVG